MNLLAFDTSTETLSLALAWRSADGSAHALVHTGAGGRDASATLVPAALALLQQAGLTLAQLDAIAFGQGPGSFTGLRTACAVAQGLAFGAGRPVLPVETLMALAEAAHAERGATQVVAVLDARMDQVYSACLRRVGTRWQRHGPVALGAPEAVQVPAGHMLVGNALAAYAGRLPPAAQQLDAVPHAMAMLRLAPGLLADGCAVPPEAALPLYIRDKVAQTTEERAAASAGGLHREAMP